MRTGQNDFRAFRDRPIGGRLVYHGLNRGENRPKVVRRPVDCKARLKALAVLNERRPRALLVYRLLDNHYCRRHWPCESRIRGIMHGLLIADNDASGARKCTGHWTSYN